MTEPDPAITDPRSLFPGFYDNPTIAALSLESRWTISDAEKMPIDIRALRDLGRIRGAYASNSECLMPLNELVDFLPNAANHALRLNALVDRVAVLDIEKTCPDELKEALCRLPALYRERSMSGQGVHLVLPLPDSFEDFRDAAAKRVVKGPHGWYEILLGHYVTFTRDVLPEPTNVLDDFDSWDLLWRRCAAASPASPMSSDIEIALDRPRIHNDEAIIEYALTRAKTDKSPADFDGDVSRYEFSVIASIDVYLAERLRIQQQCSPHLSYGETERVWLLYDAAKQVLPHRSKHDEARNGVPYLFDQALRKVSFAVAESQRDR